MAKAIDILISDIFPEIQNAMNTLHPNMSTVKFIPTVTFCLYNSMHKNGDVKSQCELKHQLTFK